MLPLSISEYGSLVLSSRGEQVCGWRYIVWLQGNGVCPITPRGVCPKATSYEIDACKIL